MQSTGGYLVFMSVLTISLVLFITAAGGLVAGICGTPVLQ